MMPNEIDREMAAEQTHCYTCGNKLEVKYECPICGEWQCSPECLERHIKTMDDV
jgi:hypothetical protein